MDFSEIMDKKLTLIIGDDIHTKNVDYFVQEGFSVYEYDDHFIDANGYEESFDMFIGDDFFGDVSEMYDFFEVEFDEFEKFKGKRIWWKDYSKITEQEYENWMKMAKDSGHPNQLKIKTYFWEIKDFY
tara:strand:- start:463 stop:846 length:384 start_codon:yes stop_codon:yes gene_type:complete